MAKKKWPFNERAQGARCGGCSGKGGNSFSRRKEPRLPVVALKIRREATEWGEMGMETWNKWIDKGLAP